MVIGYVTVVEIFFTLQSNASKLGETHFLWAAPRCWGRELFESLSFWICEEKQWVMGTNALFPWERSHWQSRVPSLSQYTWICPVTTGIHLSKSSGVRAGTRAEVSKKPTYGVLGWLHFLLTNLRTEMDDCQVPAPSAPVHCLHTIIHPLHFRFRTRAPCFSGERWYTCVFTQIRLHHARSWSEELPQGVTLDTYSSLSGKALELTCPQFTI